MIVVVDKIGEIVAKTSAIVVPKINLPNVTQINYQYGHPIEIANTLVEWSKGSWDVKKYPMIALFQDFSEQVGQVGVAADVSLNILIAIRTQKDYKAEKRYDINFRPILYPIYEEFINQINRSGWAIGYTKQHTKIDRLFWGKETIFGNLANNLNDYADCIEIQNLKLKIIDNLNC